MNSYKNKSIYWTLITHKNWRLHIAATENGLCFIGSQDENFEELNLWARKKLPQHILISQSRLPANIYKRSYRVFRKQARNFYISY